VRHLLAARVARHLPEFFEVIDATEYEKPAKEYAPEQESSFHRLTSG